MLLERKKLQLSLLQDCRRMKSYHLTWSNHVLTLETVFTSLLETEKLTDVTLLCDNGAIRAHKLILSACSNYFLVSCAYAVAFRFLDECAVDWYVHVWYMSCAIRSPGMC